MSRIIEEKFPGLLYLEGTSHEDERGRFSKPLWNSIIPGFQADEAYYTISKKDVIRGMHFQISPFEQGKFLYVSRGKILDVVVDLRISSPHYGEHASFQLTEGDHRALYIPPGFAHGYLTLEEGSYIHYVQSGKFSREHEYGIRYDSFGFKWPVAHPILSEKDSLLPPLSEFVK